MPVLFETVALMRIRRVGFSDGPGVRVSFSRMTPCVSKRLSRSKVAGWGMSWHTQAVAPQAARADGA